MRIRMPATLRVALAGGLALIGLQISLSAPAQAAEDAPFSCVPRFYQVTGTNSGSFYEYDAASNSLSRVGTGAQSGINGIGYRASDNYIYGVASSKLYKIDANGNFTGATSITGLGTTTAGGDFYNDKLVVAPTGSGAWSVIDVASSTATTFTPTSAANGVASGATWGAYDLTVQGDVAYGLNNSTLYIVKMDTHQVSSRTVSGPTSGNYGAAYSDADGNAYFYNNTDRKVFMISAAELADATGDSETQPTAMLVGGAASTPSLSSPNDGASCPDAVSPYVPTIDDTQTDADLDGTSATLGGAVNPNNTDTSVSFCYGTDPLLEDCTTVDAAPGTLEGNTSQPFTGEISDLEPGTTYYYQVVATNDVGTNKGEIKWFSTDSATESQTITFPAPDDMTMVDEPQELEASASSELDVTYTSLTPSICSVADGLVTPVAAGECEIAADQEGSSEYDAAPQVTRSFTISLASQTIDFTQPDDMTMVDDDQPLVASATSDLDVAFSSLTPSICSVADGAVTVLAPGECEIAADQAGNGNYDAASRVTKSFTVSLATQTIDFTQPDDLTTGSENRPLDATATSGLGVTFTSLSTSICTVVGGSVHALLPGDCEIAANQPGDGDYDAAPEVTRTFTISAASQTITFPELGDMTVGDEAQELEATASSELDVAYTSLTPTICSVSEGFVTALLPGECEIAADQSGDATHDAAPQQTQSFTVSAISQTITFEPFDDIVFGDEVPDAEASASSELPVTFTSNTPTVCEIDEDGTDIVVLKAGTCEIEATQDGDETHAAADPVTRSFDVDKADQTVTIDHVDDIKVDQGPAHVTVTPSRDVDPTIESLTPDVCTVGVAGAINLVSAGTCTIRVSLPQDDSYNGAEDSESFEVYPAFVVTPPAPVDTPPGSPVDISVPANGGVGPFTWSVTGTAGNNLPAGLTLDPETGHITGTVTKPGRYEVQITVTDADGEAHVSTVVITVDSSLTGAAPSGSKTVVAGGTVSLPDHSDEIVTWTYVLPSSLTKVRTAGGELVLMAAANTSGVFDVPLTVTDGVGTQKGVWRVTVLPQPVEAGTYRLGKGLVSTIRWSPRAGAVGYRVYVDGKLVGRATKAKLSLARPLGPKSRVTVRVQGNDQTLSKATRLRYVAAPNVKKAAVAEVVYFDTDLAKLTKADRKLLTELAETVRAGGFHHVRITGFTDGRGSAKHNQALSEHRAKAVRTFLKKRLRGVPLIWDGRAAKAPVASNSTPKGMALNRRVEIRVW